MDENDERERKKREKVRFDDLEKMFVVDNGSVDIKEMKGELGFYRRIERLMGGAFGLNSRFKINYFLSRLFRFIGKTLDIQLIIFKLKNIHTNNE